MSSYAQPRAPIDSGLIASAVVGNYPSANGWDTDPQVQNESGNLSVIIQASAWGGGTATLQCAEDGTIGGAATTWLPVTNGAFTANTQKVVQVTSKKLRLAVTVATITNLRLWMYGQGLIAKRVNNGA